jgi:hypothetical protein
MKVQPTKVVKDQVYGTLSLRDIQVVFIRFRFRAIRRQSYYTAIKL